MNALMRYPSCIWRPSVCFLLKNIRANVLFWGSWQNARRVAEKKMAAFKSSAHLFPRMLVFINVSCFAVSKVTYIWSVAHVAGMKNTLLDDTYNEIYTLLWRNKVFIGKLKAVWLTTLTFRVNTKEAAGNVMNFQRLWGKIHLSHSLARQ